MSAARTSTHDPTVRRPARDTRLHRLLGSAVLMVALAFLLAPSSASAQGPQGCDYADSGSGRYADTICWIDFSSFNVAQAISPAGQPMSVSLPGGYTVSFNVQARPVPGYRDISACIDASGVPSAPGWPLGSREYTGIAGEPGLLNSGPPGGAVCTGADAAANLILANIAVRNAAGQPVTGYGMVSTESEASIEPEGIRWTSDVPLTLLDTINAGPGKGGCVGGQVTGFGTTTVTCAGRVPAAGNVASEYGTSLVFAESPTFFNTASLSPSFTLGTAYGFVTSKVRLNKVADQLHTPSDSFNLAASSGATVLGSGSTGGALTGTTGEVTVLSGGSFELAETGAAATDLTNYKQSWTCERNGVIDPSLGSTGTTTKTVTPGIGDFIDCTVTNTLKRADVTVVKSATTSPIVPGEDATFELRATNNGPDEARSTRVSDVLPADFSFVSASQGCVEAGGTLTCTIAALAPGASQTFTVTGRVASSLDECLENTATVASDTFDPNSANNSSTVCTPIKGKSNVSITKVASATTVPTGGQLMYTLVVKNDGPSDDPGVEVTDALPAGLALVAAKPSQGTCTTAGNTAACELGALKRGGSAQVLVTANVTATSGCIPNTARVRGAHEDPDPADNQASAQVCVEPPPPAPATFDLAVDKRASATRVMVGQSLTYTIVVSNNGPDAAPEAKLTDTYNSRATVVSVRTTQGDCTKAMPITCSLGRIESGASATVTVVIKPRVSGRARNAASATSCCGTDRVPDNNMDTVDITVRKVALTLSKVASRSSVAAGDTLGYRIRVRNPTKGEARNVRLCDRLPSGLSFVSSSPRAQRSGGQRCWTIKSLKAGQSRTYRVTVRTSKGANGRKVNRATLSGPDTKRLRANDPIRVRGVATPVTG